jgi:serine/threonine protein kinase
MGMVFRAEDPGLGRILALKVMLPSVAAMAENRQRFHREAEATARVNHPNVIPIYAIGEDRGVPYLAMPLLKGELLEARLNRERRLPVRDAVRITREVAEGLAAAHQHNLIHRDIKPANLWLETSQRRGGSDRVKILDFGLARMGDAGLTTPGAVLGTPAYMAPEQAKGLSVDYRCDLFSLGSVMYRMLTGERAFQGNEVFAVLMALTTVHPTPPHEVNPEVPPGLSKLVMHLLAKEPGDRPQSAREVVETLHRLGLTSGVSSTDRLAIPPSSGSIPVVPADKAISGSSATAGSRSRLIGVWAAIILLLCLGAFLWTRGFFSPRPRGNVRLSVNPPDTRVLLDGETVDLDNAGLATLALTTGHHELQFRHDEYRGDKRPLEIVEGDNAPVTVELKRIPREQPPPPAPRAAIPPEPKVDAPPAPPVAPPKNVTKETSEAPIRPPEPRPEKTSVTETKPAKVDSPAPAKVDSVPPAPRVRDEDTAVKETKPPLPIMVNRHAARWVIEHGGVLQLKVPGVSGPIQARSLRDVPIERFSIVLINLAKRQGVDAAGLAALEGLKDLTQLDLSGTAITDAAIAKLKGLRSLTTLILYDNADLTDAAIPDLKQLTGLKNLDLQNTKISRGGVAELRAALPNCKIVEP